MPALSRSSSRYRAPFDPITAVLFKIIQAITYLFVLAVLFMNPIAKQGIINPKAEYIITVTWPDRNPNDIDTYVEDGACLLYQIVPSKIIDVELIPVRSTY